MTSPRLVIFDCDGVLVDSEAPVVAAEAALLRDLGVDLSDDAAAELFVGHTEPGMRRAASARGIDIPEAFWTRRRAVVHDAGILDAVGPIEGISAVIDALGMPYGLASSSDHARIERTLAAAGLLDRFPAARRFSAQDVEHGKPAPDLFLFAAERLGARPGDCLVIEDSLPGVTAAAAAGMPVIGFVAGAHCPPGHDRRLQAAGADAIAADADDLQRLLRSRGALRPPSPR